MFLPSISVLLSFRHCACQYYSLLVILWQHYSMAPFFLSYKCFPIFPLAFESKRQHCSQTCPPSLCWWFNTNSETIFLMLVLSERSANSDDLWHCQNSKHTKIMNLIWLHYNNAKSNMIELFFVREMKYFSIVLLMFSFSSEN